MTMMRDHNFKDKELFKRWRAAQKKNKMGKKLMDKNKQGNCYKSFLFPTRGHAFSWSYSVRRKMNAESVIDKLQRVAREKEAQRLDHRRKEEAEGEALRNKE